jgi:ABC-type transport system involved in multi-copper enzyme maturation permease subunit
VNGALAVGRYTLIELSRRRILLVFFILGAIGIVILGVGLKVLYSFATSQGSFGAPNTDPAALNRYLELAFVNYVFSALGVFGLLIAFAIGMTAIYHDLESGAAVSIFAKPVSRFAFAVGKIGGAVLALMAIVGLLAVETRIVMFLFGGGLEGSLTGEAAAVVANTMVVMLIVLALSTWMNNIVAAVVAFVYYNVITGVIAFVHKLFETGVIKNDVVKTIFDILYWVVPHELVSSAPADLAKAQIALSNAQTDPGVLAAVPSASGWGDIAWWAFVIVFFAGMVYFAVRRRQV